MNRITELEKLIQKYQASYYNGEAEISDGEFDLLWDELKVLAPKSDVLKKVGTAHGVDGFPKARHLIPMGSQDKASNEKEFQERTKKIECSFVVQFKMDGASLELQYKNGKLTKAVTRGDGIIGDDIPGNARRMQGVVEKLDLPFTGGVRGEVIMTHKVWKSKYPDKANCRNAANGLMRRKDGVGCENLEVIVYDASAVDNDDYFKNELEKIEWLKKCGFTTTETKVFETAYDVVEYRNKIDAKRDKLPFDIDGLVVKSIETDMSDLRKARPEKQIAYKFELETAFSVLREIEWSESGATFTPIGIIDPVRIAGTTVKRANLNNPGMIRAMGLKIGSIVTVVKRGEIIPKIEGLAPVGALPDISKIKMKAIQFPKNCSCGSELIDVGTRLYCPNPECPKRLLQRLEKWVSVLDIRELGTKLIRQIFDRNRVRHIHEIYTLTAEELSEYDRMGEKSAIKVIRHIQTPRELSLAAFVAGFNLEGIAETTMEKISLAGFDTLKKLRKASVEQLSEIYGLGEITASVIVEGLKECTGEMDAVLKT
ncbi:MAG: DNA ligase (NAD(+)) LigA, partial [Treponema sp.]|nr:DNA ligase (NAD(+)) LigA [Treponema sp.]